jgi:hypothetical protein
MLLMAMMEAASACSFATPPPSDEELFAKASAVFIGHVYRVEEAGTTHDILEEAKEKVRAKADLSSIETMAIQNEFEKSAPSPLVEGTFRVIEVLKGRLPADSKVRSLPFVFCGGAVVAGVDYLFFLYGDNFVFPSPINGTRPLLNWPDPEGELAPHQRTLTQLRELSRKEPR